MYILTCTVCKQQFRSIRQDAKACFKSCRKDYKLYYNRQYAKKLRGEIANRPEILIKERPIFIHDKEREERIRQLTIHYQNEMKDMRKKGTRIC